MGRRTHLLGRFYVPEPRQRAQDARFKPVPERRAGLFCRDCVRDAKRAGVQVGEYTCEACPIEQRRRPPIYPALIRF